MVKVYVSGKRPKLKEIKQIDNYSKVGTFKGHAVYAKRIRLEGKSGRTVRKGVSYSAKQKIVYDPKQKRYRTVSHSTLTTITTPEGEKIVNLEQLKYLYKKTRGVYHKTSNITRYDKKFRGEKLPRMMQLALLVKFKIKGRAYTVEGFSKLNNAGKYEMAKSEEQAVNKAKAILMERHAIEYDVVKEAVITILERTYVRWVT